MAETYTIGSRVFEWTLPGVIRRIEIVSLGVDLRAGAAAFVSGLHPSHLEREDLAGLSLTDLADRWPDHMAEQMGERWSTPDYLLASSRTFALVVARFVSEMGVDVVDAAEGNSQGDEAAPSALDEAPETREAAGVS